MSESAPRVLCYSPYTTWALHGQWEATILHAARLRGAEVRYVLCDGLYSDCDVYWQATRPRHENSCAECMLSQRQLAESLGIPHEWLSRFVTLDERRAARVWSEGLPADGLADAVHGDWRVGAWVRSSLHSHFRRSQLDLADPEVERAYRSYLFSGLVACFALSRLLAEADPDVLLLFNGRQSSTRIAFELARARGVRLLCHERGRRRETLALAEDEKVGALAPTLDTWAEWEGVPLTRAELERTARLLEDRALGRGLGWKSYSPPPQDPRQLREALGLSADRPVWALFNSSDDESAAEEDWQGPFARQLDWIERSVAWAASHPELDLVVRVHPNLGGRKSTGANAHALAELAALLPALPANVRMVMPDDDVSTYTLMDLAEVGLVFHSTVALELACKGKPVVVAAGNLVGGTSFVRTVESARGYEALLDELLAGEPERARIAAAAHRFAHAYWFRRDVEFPLVAMPDPHTGVVQWRSPDELVPGRDAGVDRVVRVLLDGEPVAPPPGPEELARDAADEAAFFAPRPRVSVVVPCYDYGRYLEEAVGSVLVQTYRDFEVIVVDDGSSDDSLAVARRLEAAHEQVTVLAQENSGQPAIARNNGIALARGEYVVCLDADDRLSPGFLAATVATLDAHPEAGIAYPAQQDIGESDRAWPHVDYDARKLRTFNFVPTASLFRRAAWEAVGGYATNVRGYEDWDFWLGCSEHGFAGVPARGAVWHYRIHGASLYGDASAVDPARKAQIMANHPALFSPEQLEWARDVLRGDDAAIAASGPTGVMPDPAPRRRRATILAVGAGALEAEGIEVAAALPEGATHDWYLAPPPAAVLAGPFPGLSLAEAVEAVDALGYTAIAFASADPDAAPAVAAWKPAAERKVFAVPFLALREEDDLAAARAEALGRSLHDLLLAQALRASDLAATPLDAGRVSRFVGLPAERLQEAGSLVSRLARDPLSAGRAVEAAERPVVAALARVLRAESTLSGDHEAAHAVARLEAALAAAPAVEGARSFAALAFADELVADPSLLSGYGASFGAGDDATLVIVAPGEVDALLAAVAAAGLDREDAADLLAVQAAPPAVDAVYSRRALPDALVRLPRFDERSVAGLRDLAERRWRAAA